MAANIRVKETVKLVADASCPTHSLANISIRDVDFAIDEPIERGGTNLGPTPTDAALAALIGCTNVIGHKCANRLNIDIGHLTISATCDFDRRGVTLSQEIDLPFKKINLKIQSSAVISEDNLDRVAAEVSKYCPLAKLFRQAGTIIEEDWVSS